MCLAATVLGNEGLLDVNALALYRPCEYPSESSFIRSHIDSPNHLVSTMCGIGSRIAHLPINFAKAWSGVVYEPDKFARKEGFKCFGKGLGRGVGHLLFPQRGLVIGHAAVGIRAAYDAIKKKYNMSDDKLGFILASRYMEGFEDVQKSSARAETGRP